MAISALFILTMVLSLVIFRQGQRPCFQRRDELWRRGGTVRCHDAVLAAAGF